VTTMAGGGAEIVDVVAAVIERGGRILITRRRTGTHLAGLWEFPGGKAHAGERWPDALRREIAEELGAVASVGECIEIVEWGFAERRFRLVFFRCTIADEPEPREGQEMVWVAPCDLRRYEFPPADERLIALLEAEGH